MSIPVVIETCDPLVRRLSRHVLWDVDPGAVDEEVHRRWLIARVMDRGTRDDVRLVWDRYGADEVRGALTEAPSLRLKTIAFFAAQFDLPREAFRAWRNRDPDWEG